MTRVGGRIRNTAQLYARAYRIGRKRATRALHPRTRSQRQAPLATIEEAFTLRFA
jgi:hypothetical protein